MCGIAGVWRKRDPISAFAERLGLRYVDHDSFFRLPDTILP